MPCRCLLNLGSGTLGFPSAFSMLAGASTMKALVTGPGGGQEGTGQTLDEWGQPRSPKSICPPGEDKPTLPEKPLPVLPRSPALTPLIYLRGEHGVAVTRAATLALGALREHVGGGRTGGSGNRPCWEGQKGQGDGDTL